MKILTTATEIVDECGSTLHSLSSYVTTRLFSNIGLAEDVLLSFVQHFLHYGVISIIDYTKGKQKNSDMIQKS